MKIQSFTCVWRLMSMWRYIISGVHSFSNPETLRRKSSYMTETLVFCGPWRNKFNETTYLLGHTSFSVCHFSSIQSSSQSFLLCKCVICGLHIYTTLCCMHVNEISSNTLECGISFFFLSFFLSFHSFLRELLLMDYYFPYLIIFDYTSK